MFQVFGRHFQSGCQSLNSLVVCRMIRWSIWSWCTSLEALVKSLVNLRSSAQKILQKKIQKMPKSNLGFFLFLFLGVRFEPGFKRIVWSGCLCAVWVGLSLCQMLGADLKFPQTGAPPRGPPQTAGGAYPSTRALYGSVRAPRGAGTRSFFLLPPFFLLLFPFLSPFWVHGRFPCMVGLHLGHFFDAINPNADELCVVVLHWR